MLARLSIVAGLMAGIAAAGLVIGGILAFAPEVPVPSVAEPSFGLASASPVAVASPAPSTSGATPSSSPAASSTGTASGSVAPTASAGLFHIGEKAPSLVVPRVGGGTIDLAKLHGKPVWVDFMATWCPSCLDEFPLMNDYAARYAKTGLVILAIDVKEDEGTVASFAKQLNATFPHGLDADGKASVAWDALALPVHFWIDADGIIRDAALGGIGPDIMARGLRTILPGVTVTP